MNNHLIQNNKRDVKGSGVLQNSFCFDLGMTIGIFTIILDHKTDFQDFVEERRCENRLVDSTAHLDCTKGKSKSLFAGFEQDQVPRVRDSL